MYAGRADGSVYVRVYVYVYLICMCICIRIRIRICTYVYQCISICVCMCEHADRDMQQRDLWAPMCATGKHERPTAQCNIQELATYCGLIVQRSNNATQQLFDFNVEMQISSMLQDIQSWPMSARKAAVGEAGGSCLTETDAGIFSTHLSARGGRQHPLPVRRPSAAQTALPTSVAFVGPCPHQTLGAHRSDPWLQEIAYDGP